MIELDITMVFIINMYLAFTTYYTILLTEQEANKTDRYMDERFYIRGTYNHSDI